MIQLDMIEVAVGSVSFDEHILETFILQFLQRLISQFASDRGFALSHKIIVNRMDFYDETCLKLGEFDDAGNDLMQYKK